VAGWDRAAAPPERLSKRRSACGCGSPWYGRSASVSESPCATRRCPS